MLPTVDFLKRQLGEFLLAKPVMQGSKSGAQGAPLAIVKACVAD